MVISGQYVSDINISDSDGQDPCVLDIDILLQDVSYIDILDQDKTHNAILDQDVSHTDILHLDNSHIHVMQMGFQNRMFCTCACLTWTFRTGRFFHRSLAPGHFGPGCFAPDGFE